MSFAPVIPPCAEEPLARIKAQINRLGLNTSAEGALIISPKGKLQSWLIDLRRVFLHRETLEQIAREFWVRYRDKEPFQIAGMETAAIPLLTALMLYAPAEGAGVNAFIIRKERKPTGLCNAIEGEVTGEPIVLVDDVINSGSSAEKARSVISQAGHTVRQMFAVIDYRSKKGLRWREENGIEVSSLFSLADFELTLGRDPPPALQRYRELWRTEVPGAYPFNIVPKSAPLLVGKRLYRGCDAGKMHAFDADTGAIVWEYQVKGMARKGIMSCPLVHDGRLYFGAYNGVIYCLDAASGSEVWSQPYGEWVGASPIIVPKHQLVYFGIEYARPWAQGSIGAFDIRTGARVWEHLVRKLQHGSPAYWQGGDLIIWGTADHEMAALEAATGEIVWTFPTRRSVKYAPTIDEERGLAAFASFDTSIYVVDVKSGRKLGEWETGEICYTTPLIVGNKLFCGSGDRNFYVIDLDQMEVVKKIEMGARVYASPKFIAGRVVVATCGGLMIELDPETLEIQGRLQLPDAVTNAVAATADGRRLFVSTYMNQLYAFERLDARAPRVSSQNLGITPPLSSRPTAATQTSAHGAVSMRNFKLIAADNDIEALRQEILAQPEMWKMSTIRQDTIAVQRETESIFLRGAKRTKKGPLPLEDTHDSVRTPHAQHYPLTLRWLEAFAREHHGEESRALLAKLKPRSQVYRHFDRGEYYRVRDRYHLVISSPSGSSMVCGDEEVVMRQGELWWFDNKKPHESFNHSDEDRIHLIFDLLPNEGQSTLNDTAVP
jgi:orotate phosphoribosyltransferase